MRLAHKLAHTTIPRESNNFRAGALRPFALILTAAIVFLMQFSLNLAPSVGVNVLGYAANISTNEVINLTNQKRSQVGLSTLRENSALSEAALAKGKHMLEHDYWAHVAPDGTEPWAFFSQVNYNYRYAGENLARDFSSAGSAVEAWMASPTHKENMLSPRYQEIGIGVVEGDLNGVDTTIVVQLFGAQIDAIPSIPVASAQENTGVAVAEETLVPETPQVPQVNPENQAVVTGLSDPVASPFGLARAISIVVVGILLGLVAVDAFVIYRQGVTRMGGRSAAHLSFLGMILVILWIVKAGEII